MEKLTVRADRVVQGGLDPALHHAAQVVLTN
jgi:hypothetical protein